MDIEFTDGRVFEAPLGKIVCVGRNYAAHARELNNPVPTEPILFIKPSTSGVDFRQPVRLPDASESGSCHYEAELAVLISRPLTRASEQEVGESIGGIGLALDLTLRDLQSRLKEKSHPWEVAKSFDGACPLTPFTDVPENVDYTSLEYSLVINGEQRQLGQSRDMLNPIIPLIAHMSRHFTLLPGDIVLTGTPQGVGQLNSGDMLELSIHSAGGLQACRFDSRVE